MRQRLSGSLKQPTPEPKHSGRKRFNRLRRLFTTLFKLLRWVAPVIIGLLVIWLLGGNLLAAQQERRVDQAREQFIQQFPNTDANNSALKLEELFASVGSGKFLGIKATPTRYLHLAAPKTDKKLFENTIKELDRYLDSQLNKPNDDIDPLPENLRQYLTDHAAALEAIRTHILGSELPRWEMPYMRTLGDVSVAIPSFLNTANFQKISAVDILDKTRQGQPQAALKTLEVSWKLNQVLLEQPTLIAQLVALINSRSQAAVMRKMQGLPIEWQERLHHLKQYDLPQAFLKGLYSEAFLSVSARKYPAIYFFNQFKIFESIDNASATLPQWLSLLSDPLLKPYTRLAAVDSFDRMRQLVMKLPEQDFCAFDPDVFSQQSGISPAWWNASGGPNWIRQWQKVGKAVLRFELTQKVSQIKEIMQKQGKLPQQIPGIESSVCRDATWRYQLAGDGTASISYSKELEWMKSQNANGNGAVAPLQYAPGDRLQYSFKPEQLSPTLSPPLVGKA